MEPSAPDDRPRRPTEAVAQFFGWVLTVLGGLWVLFAGGCTLTFLGGALIHALTGSEHDYYGISDLLFAGVISVGPGLIILLIGLAFLRRSERSG
jgi:Na+/H+ antiporter NhaC